jgi:MATE family multidrug resistance protein
MSKNAGEIFRIFGFSMPFVLVHSNSVNFLNAIKKPKIITIAAIIANGVNILFNWVLIYGNLGFEAMGASGSAWATLTVRIFLSIFLMIYIYNIKEIKLFRLDIPLKNWWKNSKAERKMGYGLALILLIEVGSFASLSVFAGWMGELKMAMYTIIINFTTFVFMTTIGSSTATSILVGNANGRKDIKDIKSSTISGIIFGLSIVTIFSLLLYTYPKEIFGLYCSDIALISAILPLVIYIVFAIPVDCFQFILFNTLKARKDIKASVYLQSFSFMFILIGSGYYYSTVMKLGVKGLLLGMFTSHLTASALGILRYRYLNKKVKN